MKIGAVLLGVCLLAAGAGAGWGASAAMRSEPPALAASRSEETGAERERVRRSPRVDPARLTAQMRLMIREELANLEQPGGCQPAPEQPTEAETTDEPVDEAVEAERDGSLKTALEVVDDAIARGEWTAQQRQDVRAALFSLDQARQTQILSKLFGALNEGTLRPTEMGPPI